MNQGKLEVVKQEMVRVSVDILGISELKWTGMGEFNSDDIISTTVSRNPLKKWSSHHGQQKNPKCSTWMQSQKHNMISVHFQGKPFNITVIQVYAPTSNTKEAQVEQFYEDLQELLELTQKKRCPFHYRGLECKSRKSRDTWSKRQIWPWSTE